MEAFQQSKHDNPLPFDICEIYHRLTDIRRSNDFWWMPSNDGIEGNKRADMDAKMTFEGHVCTTKISHSDFTPFVSDCVTDM